MAAAFLSVSGFNWVQTAIPGSVAARPERLSVRPKQPVPTGWRCEASGVRQHGGLRVCVRVCVCVRVSLSVSTDEEVMTLTVKVLNGIKCLYARLVSALACFFLIS